VIGSDHVWPLSIEYTDCKPITTNVLFPNAASDKILGTTIGSDHVFPLSLEYIEM
jgi:hypothetical protein